MWIFYELLLHVIFQFSFGVFTFFLNDSNALLTLQMLTLFCHICCKYFKGKYFLQLLFFSLWIQVPECFSLNLHEMSREIPGEPSRPYAHSSGAHMSETMWFILPCLCHHVCVPLIWWADQQLRGGCACGWRRASWQILTSWKEEDGNRDSLSKNGSLCSEESHGFEVFWKLGHLNTPLNQAESLFPHESVEQGESLLVLELWCHAVEIFVPHICLIYPWEPVRFLSRSSWSICQRNGNTGYLGNSGFRGDQEGMASLWNPCTL